MHRIADSLSHTSIKNNSVLCRKDAIIEFSKLERWKFSYKDMKSEYKAEARSPELGKLLGYIRYLEDKGTHFGAQLT
jgi:hypothetical protein